MSATENVTTLTTKQQVPLKLIRFFTRCHVPMRWRTTLFAVVTTTAPRRDSFVARERDNYSSCGRRRPPRANETDVGDTTVRGRDAFLGVADRNTCRGQHNGEANESVRPQRRRNHELQQDECRLHTRCGKDDEYEEVPHVTRQLLAHKKLPHGIKQTSGECACKILVT